MKFFLPVLILLLVNPIFAQEPPSSSPSSEISPTAYIEQQAVTSGSNPFSDFINKIMGRGIDTGLSNYNKSSLPLDAEIQETKNISASQVGGQAETQSADNSIVKTAGLYGVGAGLNTQREVTNSTSNIFDFFKDLLGVIGSIFGRGNQYAGWYRDSHLPQDASTKNNSNTMETSYSNMECASLPEGIGDCAESNLLKR